MSDSIYLPNYQHNKEFLLSKIKDFARRNLQPSKTKDFYNCIFCNSGNNKNHTGALKINDRGFYCFSCGAKGNILDLYQQLNHKNINTSYLELCNYYNLDTKQTEYISRPPTILKKCNNSNIPKENKETKEYNENYNEVLNNLISDLIKPRKKEKTPIQKKEPIKLTIDFNERIKKYSSFITFSNFELFEYKNLILEFIDRNLTLFQNQKLKIVFKQNSFKIKFNKFKKYDTRKYLLNGKYLLWHYVRNNIINILKGNNKDFLFNPNSKEIKLIYLIRKNNKISPFKNLLVFYNNEKKEYVKISNKLQELFLKPYNFLDFSNNPNEQTNLDFLFFLHLCKFKRIEFEDFSIQENEIIKFFGGNNE